MPPVSSRTTSRSTPASSSGRSGEARQQPGVDRHRAQVGVQAQPLADAEQPLLGPDLGAAGRPTSGRPPRPAAPRRRPGRLERLGRQRGAGRVDGAAADQRLAQRELVPAALGHRGAAPSPPRPPPRARCRRPAEQQCALHRRGERPREAAPRVKPMRRATPTLGASRPTQPREAVGDRVAAAGAEGLAGDLETGRHLPALVLGRLHPRTTSLDHRGSESRRPPARRGRARARGARRRMASSRS